MISCPAALQVKLALTSRLVQGLPHNGEPGTVALHAVVLTAMGCLISWAAPCFNNPAFSELVRCRR